MSQSVITSCLSASQRRRNLLLIAGVFFFWGGVAASNGVLIAFCKHSFDLSQMESQFIDTAFYGAYFYGALLIYFISYFRKRDIISSYSYKRSLIVGLLMSTSGAFALYILTGVHGISFYWILGAFFVVALGFSIQQVVANLYVILLGTPESGAFRLTLAGGVNSLGTLIGPLVVGRFIYGSDFAKEIVEKITFSSVHHLYLYVFFAFLLITIIACFLRDIPAPGGTSPIAYSKNVFVTMAVMAVVVPMIFFSEEIAHLAYPQQQGGNYLLLKVSMPFVLLCVIVGMLLYGKRQAQIHPDKWALWHYPQVPLGALAIFFYVGTEVSIPSNFNALFLGEGGLGGTTSDVVIYVALFWGCLKIGRWMNSVNVFSLQNRATKNLLFCGVGLLSLSIVVLAVYLKGGDISFWRFMSVAVILFSLIFILMDRANPAKLLTAFAMVGIGSLFLGIFTDNALTKYFFVLAGLACSSMWPLIFALTTTGLGSYSSSASSFLIMMILGGAVLPPIQGGICDMNFTILGISHLKISYLVPLFGFCYLLFFAFYHLKNKPRYSGNHA